MSTLPDSSPAPAPVPPPKKKSKWPLLLVIGGLLSLCCLAGVLYTLFSPSDATPTPRAAAQQAAEQVEVEAATEAPAVEETEAPTEAPTDTPTPAPTDTPSGPPQKDIYLVGEQAHAAGIAITVLNVQKAERFSFLSADEGNIFLDVEVLIENLSRKETTPYNTLYFKVKDGTAAEYTPLFDSLEPSLKSGELTIGDKARGHVAFEVPAEASGFVLSYEPLVLFGGYKTIRVNLEQVAENAITEPETMAEFTSQVGERFESAGIAITVLNAQVMQSHEVFGPDEGMVYLDVEILIENVSREEAAPYNPLYFKIKDNQYLEYNTALESMEPSLTSGDLPKGDVVRGHVAFEVPAGVKQFVLTYEPMVLFGGYEVISIQIVLP